MQDNSIWQCKFIEFFNYNLLYIYKNKKQKATYFNNKVGCFLLIIIKLKWYEKISTVC